MRTAKKTLGVFLALAVVLPLMAQEPPAAGARAGTQEQDPQPGEEQQDEREVGRYETVNEKVWIPGALERVWVPPVYTTGYDESGRPVRVLVEPGEYRTVRQPGHYELRKRRVWVPAPPPEPTSTSTFTLHNRRKFQVQLQSIHAALPDQQVALIALPPDRVISSQKALTFDLPPGAISVTIRFKTWDWGNRRFQYPIYTIHYPLTQGPTGIIH